MDFKEVVELDNNSIVIKGVKNFNIKQILECGQCFRWEKISDNNYIIVAYRRVIEVVQNGNDVTIYNTNLKDFEEIWQDYFDLNTEYISFAPYIIPAFNICIPTVFHPPFK